MTTMHETLKTIQQKHKKTNVVVFIMKTNNAMCIVFVSPNQLIIIKTNDFFDDGMPRF
jgi:hypothetical protein